MGKLKFFGLLIAAGMFAACSDNLENAGNGNDGDTLTGEKGYVNIGINLPTTNGSSRTPGENFDDGKESEYKVNDVIIALFYGTTEDDATCSWAFKLDKADFLPEDPADNNITSFYASGVRMIQAPGEGQKVFALAIANPTDYFNVTNSTKPDDENGGNMILSTKLQTKQVGGSYDDFTGKLSDLNSALSITNINDVIGASKNDFLMTNAPISTKSSFTSGNKSDDLEIQTLAPIKVYNDKALAEGASKDNPIYVERAVAKTQVTVAGKNATLTVTTDVTSYKGATVKFEGWKLQNTNNKYFPVRRVKALTTESSLADIYDWLGYFNENATSDNNRFIGTTDKPFRTYWGIDPNYTTETSGDYTVLKTVTNWNSIGCTGTESAIEYCLENTTTAKTMEENRLTSVLLKATFTPSGAGPNTSFFMINNTSAIYTESDFLTVATAALTGGNALDEGESLQLKTGLNSGLNITKPNQVIALLEINTDSGTETLTGNQGQAILDAAGGNIKYYLNGVTYYYATVIKHFGDIETPLASTDVIDNALNYDENKHLGRYGVLRNNWYELTINSVKGPGEPEIPEIPVTPPDKKNSYINYEINVLSWAKRSQGVEL